ncbi:hypothetical protein BGP77_02060 [Saccharospirillum sp. MSK14-1]|uniref:alpha/beta fold hydrolase n=1 Tax=Saccharospirillum sp. MSK14-1 TaxID=1897632 RepID=UPI000D3C5936|nr:alpha/beta hydrolase [Saccharospirillum sp. MSK14-1]PTY36124.1 hypothetical protein BGP77_02060 [Saccharospirillum sp. MSK14-1]
MDTRQRPVALGKEAASYWQFTSTSLTPAHFYAANGFPVPAYRSLLTALATHYSLTALDNRALWPGQPRQPKHRIRCRQYADDLVRFLDATASAPVVGMGHSMGATTTVMAAAARPDLFRSLVLIEPVLLSTWTAFLSQTLPARVQARLPLIDTTLSSPQCWADRAEAWQFYRSHRAYRCVPDEALEVLLDGLLEPADNAVRLAFSRQWEVANYMGLDAVWRDLKRLRMPVKIIRARPSLFLPQTSWQRLQRLLPDAEFIDIPQQRHLLPMENPTLTVESIVS